MIPMTTDFQAEVVDGVYIRWIVHIVDSPTELAVVDRVMTSVKLARQSTPTSVLSWRWHSPEESA